MATKFINWNESYSVGNTEMDNQHKKLIDIINKLFDSFREGNAESISSEILDEMIEYANFHLNSEEKLLYKYDYPEKEEHEKKHDEFRKKITELKKMISGNSENTHYELLDYLKKWWTNHILVVDMKYSKFIEN